MGNGHRRDLRSSSCLSTIDDYLDDLPAAQRAALARVRALVGGDARCNADIARRVLDGDAGPVRDIVALNAAAALVVTDVAENFAGGVERAMETIDSGRAAATLDAFAAASRAAKQREAAAG